MADVAAPIRSFAAERLLLTGLVQGVGLRPAVRQWAIACRVGGEVRNTARGVEVFAEGTCEALTKFVAGLEDALPTAARITAIERTSVLRRGIAEFSIAASEPDGALTTLPPPDRAICPACLSELEDVEQRRFGHPLISCTNCGPRYSILDSLPFDRARTSLCSFPLCGACAEEYQSVGDRRAHAQTISCPDCGPQVWLAGADGRTLGARGAAVETAAAALLAGQIVALKGVGGYQLLVDATNQAAVVRLRSRKGRPGKPLAVLVASLAATRQIVNVDAAAERWLSDPNNPIVVLPQANSARLAAGIAPNLTSVGVMLPTTGLHALLAAACARPLVATSGNREGEPLAWNERTASNELAGIADLWLHHDRPIERPIDDSVLRLIDGQSVVLRLARGFAPLPLDLPGQLAERCVLALGGEMKSALALLAHGRAALGPHLGDLTGAGNVARFAREQSAWTELFRCTPTEVVCDLHPNYWTTRLAEDSGLRVRRVQHHHAHVAAGLLAAGWQQQTVLGVAWDGAGYGTDGLTWGGEFLVASLRGFSRVGRLRPLTLPGGDVAIREPWRIAVAIVTEALGTDAAERLSWPEVPTETVRQVANRCAHSIGGSRASSVGRLCDGLAALILGLPRCTYEAELAQIWESVAAPCELPPYELPLAVGEPAELDWRPLVRAAWDDHVAGVGPASIAWRFHQALGESVAAVALQHPGLPVVLCGGAFQNTWLSTFARRALHKAGREVAPWGLIPPGDGGLAAGQLAVACADAGFDSSRS